MTSTTLVVRMDMEPRAGKAVPVGLRLGVWIKGRLGSWLGLGLEFRVLGLSLG